MAFDVTHTFRKLKALDVPIAQRITLICGHNGAGKSTVLGLLASLSGIATGPEKTYFGKAFDANIAEIIYIDHATEVQALRAAGRLSVPAVVYDVDGVELKKQCSLTVRGKNPRARSVPRSDPHKRFSSGDIEIGADAKVPLPTIFLGMVRMLPVGESPDSRVQNTATEAWHPDDEAFMLKFVKNVIPGAGARAGTIQINRVKLTNKLSTHPAYNYSTRSVSLGQDSLGAIVTALASFHRIRRSLGDKYPGGMLIIDELDAGFHPHAIGLLVAELRKAADDLSLQIVATTHSSRLIEAVHLEGPSKGTTRAVDGVVYLRNARAPEYDPAMSLAEILDDMELVPAVHKPKPVLMIYFEDDQACEVFRLITRRDVLKSLEETHNVTIKPMPLGVGCSSLALLPSKDPYFSTVVLVVDADGSRPKTIPKNLVELPGGIGKDGKALSPERTLVSYVRDLVTDDKNLHPLAWGDVRLRRYSQENLEANLLAGVPDHLDRNAAKAWWIQKKPHLEAWGLYELWAKENSAVISAYEANLLTAVKAAAKATRAQASALRFGPRRA